MTADELRAAIASGCPHRLPDYLRHTRGREPTRADLVLWHVEYRISSDPQLEARLDRLHQRAQDATNHAHARRYLERASRIRARVRDDVIKEMGDA